jgi:flagellar motor component MotA
MIDLHQIWEIGGTPMLALIVLAMVASGLVVREILRTSCNHDPSLGNLPILAVLATCAPLIGLLGTVMGLVRIFVIDTNPQAIASGISQALLTTQVGLAIAVPLHFARQGLLRWRECRLAKSLAGAQA